MKITSPPRRQTHGGSVESSSPGTCHLRELPHLEWGRVLEVLLINSFSKVTSASSFGPCLQFTYQYISNVVEVVTYILLTSQPA